MAVDREQIGLVAREAVDGIDTGPDDELHAVGVIVAVRQGDQTRVSQRFTDPDGNPLQLGLGLQMLGAAIQAIGRGAPPTP